MNYSTNTVKVVSGKYDGSLREEYDACLLLETPESLVVLSLPGSKAYDHRKKNWSTAPDGLIEIYPKFEWYNVWHICEQHSGQNLMYVNIAMPAILTDRRIEWIDPHVRYDNRIDRYALRRCFAAESGQRQRHSNACNLAHHAAHLSFACFSSPTRTMPVSVSGTSSS